jgi:hypothetical protein
MIKKTGFGTIVASSPECDKLVVEIYFDGKFVALINQEKGPDDLEIEFPNTNLVENVIARNVPLKGFLEAVEIACQRLREDLP